MKLGLELEYWVVDDSGALVGADELLDIHEAVVPELIDPMIEIQLPPADGLTELRQNLITILETVLARASDLDKHLVPLATPLTEHQFPITSDRGKLLQRIYGDEIKYAKNCAGTHIHFDKGSVVDQLNLLTALDPAIALVSSSPYYDGVLMGMDARALSYRTHSTELLTRYRDLWPYAKTTEEWDERLAQMYETLKLQAEQLDIPEVEFTHFIQQEDVVLTPVRLREETPTVEWRAPDVALPSQILQFVSDISMLMSLTEEKSVNIGTPGIRLEEIGIPPFGELRAITATAMNDGLSERVCQYLAAMRFDINQYEPLAEEIAGEYRLSVADARKIRLEYANRLREDVETLLY
ncbi:glutamate-cysteine ligase family protein [Haladaptatus pallidirubidus]|uniref:Glutamate--cysteine ligase n=1 Tax=Haladaptatus pallidirubidus TaxID=1008152 RepID=A0AAV3UJM3_9EURY|nr:glutamate-cysteine ligase family protein [Haladaptatus pallidirubidus]